MLRSTRACGWLTALPLGDGPAADEPLGHALAALDSRWVFLAEKAASGQEERLRHFARVLRALPAKEAPADVAADGLPKPFGVVVRKPERRRRRRSWRSPTTHLTRSGSPAGLTCPQARRSRISVVAFAWRRVPRPTAAISCSTCCLTASRRSGSRRHRCKFSSVNSYPSDAVMTSACGPASTSCRRSSRGSITGSRPGPPSRPIRASSRLRARRSRAGGPLVKVASTPSEGSRELAGWLVEEHDAGRGVDHDRSREPPFGARELEAQLSGGASRRW